MTYECGLNVQGVSWWFAQAAGSKRPPPPGKVHGRSSLRRPLLPSWCVHADRSDLGVFRLSRSLYRSLPFVAGPRRLETTCAEEMGNGCSDVHLGKAPHGRSPQFNERLPTHWRPTPSFELPAWRSENRDYLALGTRRPQTQLALRRLPRPREADQFAHKRSEILANSPSKLLRSGGPSSRSSQP